MLSHTKQQAKILYLGGSRPPSKGLAGIDTTRFKPHSIRSSSTSAAAIAKVPVDTILRTAGWSGHCTFAKYYKKPIQNHCRISYREGLGMSPSIMGLTTQDPYILKEHTDLYKILKFRVNWANIKQDTAVQKLKNLVRNKCMDCRTLVRKSIHFFANFEVFEWPYLVQYWPN